MPPFFINIKSYNNMDFILMQITTVQLQKIFTQASPAKIALYLPILNRLCNLHHIFDTKQSTAAFLAQIGHESGELHYIVENLNYSAQGLLSTFGKYFNASSAAAYARQPSRIANRVYANRMSNGDEGSGDGWKFRGKGLIQITGRANVTGFSKWKGITVEQAAAYLETPEGAVEGSIWFWKERNLNRYVVANDFLGLTKAINGGTNGLPHRTQLYKKALAVL